MQVSSSLLGAVITRTDANESLESAIQSICRLKHYFCEVHIVQGQGQSASQYEGFQADIDSLELPVIYHSQQFNPNKLVAAQAIVHIQGDLQISDGAMDNLREDIVDASRFYPSVTHFCVESSLKVPTPTTPLGWALNTFLGFWIVVLMMDFYRAIFNLYKYHKTSDLRAQLVYTTFPNRKQLAPEKWVTPWIWNDYMARVIKGGAALLQVPKDNGLQFLLRSLQTHRYMGIGIWMIFFLPYYFLCALPWWNIFFNPTVHTWWSVLLTRNIFAWYWMFWYVLHVLFVALVTWRSTELPAAIILILLYPVYLTLFPVVYFYGRWHVARETWQIATKKNKVNKQN